VNYYIPPLYTVIPNWINTKTTLEYVPVEHECDGTVAITTPMIPPCYSRYQNTKTSNPLYGLMRRWAYYCALQMESHSDLAAFSEYHCDEVEF
jgi:hypothetical protein